MAKAIALAILPLVLICLPKDFFDKGESICLFTRLSGYTCPGCGLTRACMHLIHLDFTQAAAYNKLSFIVLPILCIALLVEFRNAIRRYKKLNASQPKPATTDLPS